MPVFTTAATGGLPGAGPGHRARWHRM